MSKSEKKVHQINDIINQINELDKQIKKLQMQKEILYLKYRNEYCNDSCTDCGKKLNAQTRANDIKTCWECSEFRNRYEFQ